MNNRFFAIIVVAIFVTLAAVQASADDYRPVLLRVVEYEITYNVDFEAERLLAACAMTVVNPTSSASDTIPILLYRLLKVDSIVSRSDQKLHYRQDVTTFEDWPVMQKNYVRIVPEISIGPGDSIEFVVYYSGHLLGYTETGMLYVRDRIDTAFTILRPDCGAYPELGVPSWKADRLAGMQEFNYTVSVTVPPGLAVANGGRLVEVIDMVEMKTYTFANIKPAWRIDIAIARYETKESGPDRIYFFPEDRKGAGVLAIAMKNALQLYASWWGPLPDYQGFSVIEIPDGWGSQADVTSILQTAAAFKDTDQLYQLYHELSHQWNTSSLDSIPPRWEEGFATFVQYLTIEQLDSTEVMEEATARIMSSVKEEFAERPELASTPMAEYGRAGMTGMSYSVGMLFFRLIFDLIGIDEFNRLIGGFFQAHRDSGATTEDFGRFLESYSGGQLKSVVQNWILTSTYARQIQSAQSWSEVAESYK